MVVEKQQVSFLISDLLASLARPGIISGFLMGNIVI